MPQLTSWLVLASGAPALRELHVAGNEVGDAGAAALAAQLHAAPLLRVLALGSAAGGNAVRDAGAAALCAALRQNAGRALAVNLKGNALSPAALDELRQAERDCGPALRMLL